MKKFIKWCTDYYCVRITFIVISILMFIIGYFEIFPKEWKNDSASMLIPYFSATLAVIVGFIFEILQYSLTVTIIRLRVGNTEFKKIIKKPKYLTASWWKEDFGWHIVTVIAIIIMLILYAFIVCYAYQAKFNFSILWGAFSVFVPLFGILPVAIVSGFYLLIALAISSIHAKITGKNLKHLAR